MSAPRLEFLEAGGPLARQVAEGVWGGARGTPIDLGETDVWVPTAGAARRIRWELARMAAERGTGIFPPRFVQPMAATLPEGVVRPVANRAEREGAWARVLRGCERDEIGSLFPRSEALDGDRQALGAGGMLCDLADLLAEAGWHFASPEVAEVCADDSERWDELRALHSRNLEELARVGLSDPNELRRQTLSDRGGAGAKRIVIAVLPDLQRAAERYAASRASRGVEVLVLVWKPGDMGGGFDAWGRPLSAEWTECEIPLAAEQIALARDAEEEATSALDFCCGRAPDQLDPRLEIESADSAGDYGVVLADGEGTAGFRAEVLRRGGRVFVPDGERLATSEPAVVFSEWQEWSGGGRLRNLRRLLECRRFADWIGAAAGLSPSELLRGCDFLRVQALADTVGQARALLREPVPSDGNRDHGARASAGRLLEALGQVSELGAAEIVTDCWADGGEGNATARQVLELWRSVDDSPMFRGWPDGRDAAFARALATARVFGSAAEPGEVELLGWLEAPWVEAKRLMIAGCVEGSLPTAVTEHAFLPDSRRRALGLIDNAARSARDAYLLTCLLRTRAVGEIRCSFSKVSAEGGPALPSNLLLRCGVRELPARVRGVFATVKGGRNQPRRENNWKWRLAESDRRDPPVKISPTDFSQYLACPFRFYFSRVRRAEGIDGGAREMDALQYGTLLHAAVEEFGRTRSEETNAGRIEDITIGFLLAEARKLFGRSPAPAVRVQLEALKVRLREFARVQAAEFAAGWRIIETEKKLSWDEAEPLLIGKLALSAKIDRIERHPDHGLRILDYKSFATAKAPEDSHFGSAKGVDLEAAIVERGQRRKAWKDLQLPTYRRVAERWYPGEPVRLGYFLLPADPSAAGVLEWDLDEETYASALACAEVISGRIGRGVFWPPKELNPTWDDPLSPIFSAGDPVDWMDAETIRFLEGRLE
ncbi:MAG: PD-(D/E)XK nuclease family protein [Chthoniobacterales bacterium]